MAAGSPFVFLRVLMDTHGFMPGSQKEAAAELARFLKRRGLGGDQIPHVNQIARCFVENRDEETDVRSDHTIYGLIAKLIWAHGIDVIDIDRALEQLGHFWHTRADGSRWRQGIPVAQDEQIQAFIRRGIFAEAGLPAIRMGEPHI